jgi:hypothetical protein
MALSRTDAAECDERAMYSNLLCLDQLRPLLFADSLSLTSVEVDLLLVCPFNNRGTGQTQAAHLT